MYVDIYGHRCGYMWTYMNIYVGMWYVLGMSVCRYMCIHNIMSMCEYTCNITLFLIQFNTVPVNY